LKRLKFFAYVSTILVAFAILFASVLRTASVEYSSPESAPPLNTPLTESDIYIDYFLPYPGSVLPDSPFWPLKAIRDRIWLLVTTNPTRKVELKLLFADKRLGSSQILFQKGKVDVALSTLTKAEKYLEEASYDEEIARRGGIDTTELLRRLTKSSLKHFQVIQEISESVHPEVKPIILQSQDFSRKAFERGRNGLLEKGETPPENPFDWR
jgi:hypothetical protein